MSVSLTSLLGSITLSSNNFSLANTALTGVATPSSNSLITTNTSSSNGYNPLALNASLANNAITGNSSANNPNPAYIINITPGYIVPTSNIAISTASDPLPAVNTTPVSSATIVSLSSQGKAAEKDIKNNEKLATAVGKDLDTIQNYVSTLTALAKQAASGQTTNDQRAVLAKQFANVNAKLQNFVNNAEFDGQKLFDGNFTLNAGTALGQYIFTGAANQPTQAQATLSLPDLDKSLSNLSISSLGGSAATYGALQNAAQSLTTTSQSLNDFKASLTFASNTLYGKANNGPSITQYDALNQAQTDAQVAGSAVSNILNDLSALQNLAKQASSSEITDTDRGFLNQEASSLYNNINTIVSQSEQSGVPLDGSFSNNLLPTLHTYLTGINQPTASQDQLQIGNLQLSGLFGASVPDLSTQAGAQAALTSIGSAIKTVSTAQSGISNFNYAINYAQTAAGLNTPNSSDYVLNTATPEVGSSVSLLS